MNFKTHNDKHIDTSGCGLMGCFKTDYETLVKTFGQPNAGFDKTDVEWHIRFDDGSIATIYNWKDGVNYCGDEGLPVEAIKEWHVGGKSMRAYYTVYDLIKKAKQS
jgi:hypothetical protein